MKISVERDVSKDEMLIAVRLPLRMLDIDKTARDRLDYLMLRVAVSTADSCSRSLMEALLHVITSLDDKAEKDRLLFEKARLDRFLFQQHLGQK